MRQTRWWHHAWVDGAAIAIVLTTSVVDINLEEAYNAWSVTTFTELARWLVILLFTAVLLPLVQLLPLRMQSITRRCLLIAALAIVVHWLIGPAIYDALAGETWLISGICVSLIICCAWLLRSNAQRWRVFRSTAVAVPVIFVSSQFLLGSLLAKDIVWPNNFLPEDSADDRHRVATILLLLDEMNSSDAVPVAEYLSGHGLEVRSKPVKSVGQDTIDVVPAMFLGHSFPDAHTCGTNTVCSDVSALDFGRVRASRPDIDIVGFYHPYCAIKGLRYCSRRGMQRALFDNVRIRCALNRRLGWNMGIDAAGCQSKAHEPWLEMTERMLSDLERAPTLSQGGVLFAHLPLPHPPGRHNGSMSAQYQSNVERATSVIANLLGQIKSAGLEPRIIVFSDHPLRQEKWCRTQSHHFDPPCRTEPYLEDDKVPLIVAARSVPDISSIESNRDIFKLASAWSTKSRSGEAY
jgi:hypothetical protein